CGLAIVLCLCLLSCLDPSNFDTPVSFAVRPADVTVLRGDSLQMRVEPTGQQVKTIWTTSDPRIAIVSASGVVRALATGTTLIKAQIAGQTGRTVVFVSAVLISRT